VLIAEPADGNRGIGAPLRVSGWGTFALDLRCDKQDAIDRGVIMRILRVVAVALLLAGAGAPARADDAPSPEAVQAAQELFAILSGDMMKQLTGQVTDALWPQVEAQAHADKIDDATLGEMRQAFDHIQVSFIDEAMKDAPPIYARHFTVAELHELAAFYKSPTGAKALHVLPQVMGEFTTALVPRLQAVQKETGEAFDKILRAHGYLK